MTIYTPYYYKLWINQLQYGHVHVYFWCRWTVEINTFLGISSIQKKRNSQWSTEHSSPVYIYNTGPYVELS